MAISGTPDRGNGTNELLSTDPFREVRYHTVDAKGECALDITGIVWCIDEHEQILTVECVHERARGCVVPETDV